MSSVRYPVICCVVALASACGGTTAATIAPPGGDAGATTLPADAGQAPEPTCAVDRVQRIGVTGDGLYGYPPYAAWGCRVVYVAPTGDLVSRDLATGAAETIAPRSDSPRRPALSADTIAWERGPEDRPEVVVRVGGVTLRPTGAFALGAEPRVDGDVVVFTGFAGTLAGDSDIFLYDVAKRTVERLTDAPGQQRFADVSATHIAWTDFSEDPDGRFDDDRRDVSDVVVHVRATGARVTRKLPGKQAFPVLVSGSHLGYLDWAAIHPEPKLEAYVLRAGDLLDATRDRDIATVRSTQTVPTRPTGRAGVLEWIDHPETRTRWFRAPADGSTPPAEVQGTTGLELYPPQAARTFSLVATRALGASPAKDVFLMLVAK